MGTTTLNGGFNGNRIQVTSGALVLNGGTTSVASEFVTGDTTSETYSIRIGALAGNTGALTVNNAAKITYRDFLHGSKAGNGNIVITGTGTQLIPVQGIDITSQFIGGGAGTSNVTIDDHALVTTNQFWSNRNQNTTVSNGATLTAANYQANGVDPDTGLPQIINYGGEVYIGFYTYDPAAAAPLSTLNVNTGGTVNARFTYLAGAGIGQTGDANINGGTLNGGSMGIADPIPDVNATIGNAASFNRSTMNITNGGVVNALFFAAATANTSKATVNVDGVGSKLSVGDGPILMGGITGAGNTGAGSSDLNITAGGVVDCSQVALGDYTAVGAAASYSGNNISVSGAGSKLLVNGVPAVPESAPGAGDGEDAFSASMFITDGTKRKSTLSVTNGGEISLLNDSSDLNQNGAVFLGNAANTTSIVNVDGAGSTFNAGVAMDVIIGSGRSGFTNATATINVQNGGTLFIADDGSESGGEFALGPTVSTGASITVNVGGGATTADKDSLIEADGIVYVGGNGPTSAPVKGVTTTINVNNGVFYGGVVAVYQGSTVNVNKGQLIGSLLTVPGGTIKLSSTAAAGTGVMYADQFDATNGGSFDIGNSGGVSLLFDAADTDLTEIKTLINAGLTGGVNSIRSDLVTPTGNLAIGYFLRGPTSPRTSFFGIDLDSTHSYVLFRVTLKGDADLSGNVNFDDLIALAQNYNGTNREWYQGDSTHDGIVNFDDLIALAQNYNQARPGGISIGDTYGADFAADWAFAQSLVPEPTTLGLFAAAGSLVTRRRRR